MGVIDKVPGYGEDGLYTFSSRPVTPRDKSGDLLVKFQAVSRTHQTLVHHYIRVNSKDRLSHVRRSINIYFKDYFERGFIFLCKTKEVLKSDERQTTMLDILPKIPHGKPTEKFRYPDVEYKRVSHTYDGRRYIVMCACVVFLYERSKVSHWSPHELHQQLCENLLDGFSFIPTDIMSWKPKLIELKATSLHINAACGNIKDLEEAIKKLPKTPKVCDICDERNATPLHYAAENGKLDACEILINGIGRDQIFVKDINGRSPLHCALYRRRRDVIVYLLQLNSEVIDADNIGNDCIDLLLLQRQTDIDHIAANLEIGSLDKNLQFYMCYLMLSRKKEKESARLLQMLPDYESFNLNMTDLDCSLFHLSSKLSSDLTEILLQKQFPKLERDIEGNLPFHVACQHGNIAQVKLLFDEKISDKDLNKGIKIALRNRKFELCLAIDQIKTTWILYESTVCMIMEALNNAFYKLYKNSKKQKYVENVAGKLMPLLKDQAGALEQYMFDAAILGLDKTMSLLKSCGISFDLSDEMKRTPLHEACQRNHKECVSLLLKGDANPNATDWRGATPLHYACERGNDAIVKILIQSDRDIDLGWQDDSGRTPLMVAMTRKHNKVIRLLIQNYPSKCNIRAVDRLGQSVLHYLPITEDELEDILLHSYKNEKVTETKLTESSQKEQKTIVWNENLKMTSSRALEHEYMHFSKSHAFEYQDTEIPWNDYHSNKPIQPESILSPSKKYEKCAICNNIIKCKNRHLCCQNETADNDNSVVELRAFEYQKHKKIYSCPLQNALKSGKISTFKKLAQLFPFLLKEVDTLGRNILDFAIQQGSMKILKIVLDIVKPRKDTLHHLIMYPPTGKTETKQHIVEYFLQLGLQTNLIPEPINVTHIFCEKERYRTRDDFCKCLLKSYLPVEAAVFMQNFAIFNSVLEKTKIENIGIALHIAVYFGLSRFVDAILKKMHKREIDREMQEIEKVYILDIACRSPYTSENVFESLLKYRPDCLDTQEIFTCDDLSEFRPNIWEIMNLCIIEEKTPLAKLLSSGHFHRMGKKRAFQKSLDKAGCLLIRSGVHLGTFQSTNKSDGSYRYIHGICEALLPALESGHFESVGMMIQREGHLLWHCALTKHKCDVQSQFSKIVDYVNCPKEYIKYILSYSCQKHVPEVILQLLIESGMEIEGARAINLSVKEFEINDRMFAVDGCKSVLEKVARCVLEIVTSEHIFETSRHGRMRWRELRVHRSDVVRLIKIVPGAVTCFSRYNFRTLSSLIVPRDLRMLRDCTILLNSSGQPDCTTYPSGTTLLHLACSTANLEFVKLILKAPLPVNVDAKTVDGLRPVNIAVIYGSWDIYKFLMDNGAKITADTFIACCSDDRYKDVKVWAERIRRRYSCEKASSKTKKRILIDLYERQKIDWNYFGDGCGSPLYNALDSNVDDIVIYLVETDPSLLVTALNHNVYVVERMQLLKEATLVHVYNVMSSQVSRLKMKTLGQILLQTAKSKRKNLTETITKTFHRVLDQEQWNNVVQEKEKHGRNIFHFVAIFGWESIARELIQVVHPEHTQDFSLNKKDRAGASPLWYALAFKRWKTARLYLLSGVNPSLHRAVPGFFTKGPRPAEIPDVCFEECKRSREFISIHGLEMSSRRKIKSSKDKDISVTDNVVSLENPESTDIKKSSSQLPVMTKDQRRVQILFRQSCLSRSLGFSLIHFASRLGDTKLFDEIIGISENKLRSGGDFLKSGYRLAFLGNHSTMCDIYKENGVHYKTDETFYSIVWQALKNEHIERNVYHFMFGILGFVFDNAIQSQLKNASVIRKQAVPKYSGHRYKIDRTRFRSYLTKLGEELSNQSVDPNLIVQLETKIQYIFDKIHERAMERQNFETYENSSHSFNIDNMENIMTRFLKSLDVKSKVGENEILLLLSMNQTWIIKSLITASKSNRFVFTLLKKQLLWNLNTLDCILISTSLNHGRTDKVVQSQENQGEIVGSVVDLLDLSPHETTVQHASMKCVWSSLQHVAIRVIPKERELKVCWQVSLVQAVKYGQLDFMKSIIDNISISKLPESVQASFAALLCCGANYGQTDIVKYLFRKSVPIKVDTENPMFVDLLDKIYRKHCDVVEYAIESKQPETVDAVIKFCRYDREFMRGAQPERYFKLAAKQGIWKIMKQFVDLFGTADQPTRSSWEKFFIEAASKGQEDFCANLLALNNSLDVLCVDKTNKNALHYCGIHNMKIVAKLVIEESYSGLDLSDSDGKRPIDYAVVFGNVSVVDMFMKAKAQSTKEKIDTVETYGWFRFLLKKISTEELNISPVDLRHALPKVRTLDLKNLFKREDDDAAATLIYCSKHIPNLLTENPTENGFILHDAIKYGCIKSFHNVMAYFDGKNEEIRQLLKHEYKGLTPLAVAVSHSQLAVAEYIFQFDDGEDWTFKKSSENLLHLAIHTGNPKMIELVGSKTAGKLCGAKDICGFTPEMYLCALGLQNHYSLLKSNLLVDPWIDSHVGHSDNDPDMSCFNCLLNKCIGWSKLYHSASTTDQPQPIRSTKQALPPDILSRYFWKLGTLRSDNKMLNSILVSCGFDTTYLTLLNLMSRKEGIEKMISIKGIESTLDEFKDSPSILENILAASVVANSEDVFVALLDHAVGLNKQMKKSFGVSLFEAVLGLSRLNLLVHLNKKITAEENDYSTFKEMSSILPQKHLWISKLDCLGGEQWPNFKLTPERHEPRILKSDLWLIQSLTFPESIREEVESLKENIIHSEFSDLKYGVEFDSFRKIPHFAGYSDVWIQCFLTSSVVLNHIKNIKNSQEVKFSNAKSVKVTCLTSGTTDHPKVTIDNTGALLNQIRVSKDSGCPFVRQDRSFCQRPNEIQLKEDVNENVVPFFEHFIQKEFGLQIKIKVDWNAIELRKRTYNTDVIFKSLNGEMFGNKLGGLEDVLYECRDLKNDIESMFDEETMACAMRDCMNLTEIIVSFDDKLITQQTSNKSGQHVLGETVWKFTITKSRLNYDRSQFPLWQHLTLHRAICASVCNSIYTISAIDGLQDTDSSERNHVPTITFEVDLQSFGISNSSTLRTLLCQDVSRELVAIAFDCSSMLRLKNMSKKVLLKNTISLQHTGVSFQENVTTIHICCNETDSKEWIVERSNSFNKLAEAEDKQLMVEWAPEKSEQLNQTASLIQKKVQEETGVALSFQSDEKRFLITCFSKFRREMSHPHDLLRRSLEMCYQTYGDVYIRILEDFLLCQSYPTVKHNMVDKCKSGVWVKVTKQTPKPGILTLSKQLVIPYFMSKFEIPVRTILPVVKNETFELLSETKVAKGQIAMWEHKILTEHNQADMTPEIFCMRGNIFRFSDLRIFQKQIQNLPLRPVISQDVARALECGYHDALYDKVVNPSGRTTISDCPLGDTFEIHSQTEKEIRKLLNIDNVEIDWQSFVYRDDTTLRQKFAECLNALVDTFYDVFPKTEECYVRQRIELELHALFSGIAGMQIVMLTEIDFDSDEPPERQMHDGKYPGVTIQIVKGSILKILFKQQEKISKFPDLLYRAGIELAEMKVLSMIGCKGRKVYTKKKSKEATRSIIRPTYDKVMLQLSNIRSTLTAINTCVKSFQTVVPDEIEDFYFVTSSKTTGFVVKHKTLLYGISDRTVDPGELAIQLLEEFQFQALQSSLVLIDLCVIEPVTFNKNSRELEVIVEVNNYNSEAREADRALTKPGGYSVTVEGNPKELGVTKVTREKEHLILTIPWDDDVKLKNNQYIIIHHERIRHENSQTLLFKGGTMKSLKSHYSLEKNNVIKLKRKDKFKFLLEHGLEHGEDAAKNKNKHVHDRNEAEYEKVFVESKVKFTVYYQKKCFPSADPTVPFDLKAPGKWYDDSWHDKRQVYNLEITDSERHFRFRAQCLCCKRDLDVITRIGRFRSGQDLRVNYPDS